MLEPKAKALAIARILRGESTPVKEAARLSCDIRTIERAVARERARLKPSPSPGAPPVPPAGGAPPPPGSAPGAPPGAAPSVLSKVIDAAEGPDKKPDAKPGAPPDPAADGKRVDGEYIIRELGRIKAVAVGIGAIACGVPIDDKVVSEESRLSELAKTELRESPEDVAEYLRKNVGGGPWFLFGLLALDAIASGVAIYQRRAELHPKRPPIKKEIEGEGQVKA